MNKLFGFIIAGLGLTVFVVLMILVFGALMAFPVMWLWNSCLVGTVAGISPITSFWHAWGLIILCGFLFKSSSSKSS